MSIIASIIMAGHNLITPSHRSIRKYYEHVSALQAQGVLNEMNVRSPFESLLQETARLKDWTFIAELSGKSGGAIIRPDGTLRDRNSLPRGYWEGAAPLGSLSPKGASYHSPGQRRCEKSNATDWRRVTRIKTTHLSVLIRVHPRLRSFFHSFNGLG